MLNLSFVNLPSDVGYSVRVGLADSIDSRVFFVLRGLDSYDFSYNVLFKDNFFDGILIVRFCGVENDKGFFGVKPLYLVE